MSRNFHEIDSQETPLGLLSLRRRRMLSLGDIEIHEIKLGEAFLMSSLFHEAEVALAHRGLSELTGVGWDVVVGGLGLGYTAVAALEHREVASLLVIEALPQVIGWHLSSLVPLGEKLVNDPRSRLVHADFFASASSASGFDPDKPGRKFHAVLLDIDHSPRDLLHGNNAAFYQPEGLRALSAHLLPGGVFALWSDDEPDAEFLHKLGSVFATARAHVVTFDNPILESKSDSTVYVACLDEDKQDGAELKR
ncbi:MAG: spermidine synthase [Chthoniobacterales bacterium]